MADRNPSFFGPVLPQEKDAPEAFSADELQRIRGRRIEVEVMRAAGSAWPLTHRFRTMYPAAPRVDVARVDGPEGAGGGVRGLVS